MSSISYPNGTTLPISPDEFGLLFGQIPSLSTGFGADPTGVLVSTAQVQDGFNSILQNTGRGASARLFGGAGIYLIDRTIALNNFTGLRFQGDGAKTIFKWIGNATDPMFLVEDTFQCDFDDFEVQAIDPAFPLAEAFRIVHTSVTAPPAITQNKWSKVRVNGQVSSAIIANITNFGTIISVTTTAPHGFTNGGNVSILGVNGIKNVNGTFGPITVTGPTTFTYLSFLIPFGSYSSAISPGLCNQNNIGYAWRMMVGAGGDVNNDFHVFDRCWAQGFEAAFASIEGGNAHAIVFNQCLGYGGRYLVTTRLNSPRVGNFKWKDGFASVSDTVFSLGDNASLGPIEIDGIQCENCQRLITVDATNEGQGILNYTHAVDIKNVRFQGQGLHADGGVAVLNAAGPFSIEQCTFGLPFGQYFSIAFNFQYNPASAEYFTKRAFRFANNVVNGANFGLTQFFPGEPPSTLENSVWRIAAAKDPSWGVTPLINNAAGYFPGGNVMAIDGLAASGLIVNGTPIILAGTLYFTVGNATVSGGGAVITVTPTLLTVVKDNTPIYVGSGYIGTSAVAHHGLGPIPQISAAGSSTAGNQIAGLNFKIDSSDLWQVLTDNAAANNFFLQFLNDPALRFLKIDTSGNVTIPIGQFFANFGTVVKVPSASGLGYRLINSVTGATVALLSVQANQSAQLTICDGGGGPNITLNGVSPAGSFNIEAPGASARLATLVLSNLTGLKPTLSDTSNALVSGEIDVSNPAHIKGSSLTPGQTLVWGGTTIIGVQGVSNVFQAVASVSTFAQLVVTSVDFVTPGYTTTTVTGVLGLGLNPHNYVDGIITT